MSLLPVLAPHSPVALAYGRLGDVRDLTPALCAIESAKAIGVMNKENPRKAARVIAGWLSTREAVWWAALCQSQLMEIPGIQPETEILKAVIEWVRQPGEATRAPFNNQQMKPASVSLGHLVAAVTLTRDSLSPVEKSPVPCPAGLAHRMVALSVLAGAELWPSSNRPPCLAHFLELGLDVSEGKLHWTGSGQAVRHGLRPLPQASMGHKRLHNIWENW